MIEIYPLKQGRLADEVTTLPVLIQLQPSDSRPKLRPPLNLGLVLDRSGSMNGHKLEQAIEAACEAVKYLTSDDKATVVTFDSQVELLYSGVGTSERVVELLRAVESGGATALYDGWARGELAMRDYSDVKSLSRLILLTDGEANEGLCEPSLICQRVAHGAARSVQTTTLGFGDGYNEELLRDMAQSGGGNHRYVQNAEMLPEFFVEEMRSLGNTQGVSVKLTMTAGNGVKIAPLKNKHFDLEGRLRLANLEAGQPLSVLLHLKIPPQVEGDQLKLTLDWHDLVTGEPAQESLSFNVPSVSEESWEELQINTLVQEQVAIDKANEMREMAMRFFRLQAPEVGLQWLHWALDVPCLPEDEKAVLEDLIDTLERGDYSSGYKKSAMYSHGHGHGHARTTTHYIPREKPTAERKKYKKLPLGNGPILSRKLEGKFPKWSRLEGMLRGHFFGERLVRGNRTDLGEGSSLSAATLHHRLDCGFQPRYLAQAFHRAPVMHPTNSLRKFRERYENGSGVLMELGSDSAGCAAIRRMCPLLINLYNDEREDLILESILATIITHRDNLAITSSIGYLVLLWELLHQPVTPEPEFYSKVFLEAIEGLEWGPGHISPKKNKVMEGWQGYIQEYLPKVLGEARKNQWTAETAMRLWGSGPYLLEIIPTVLYILELHGHDPDKALRVASTNTYEPDTPAILIGAALGALHGSQPGWFLHDELEELLETVKGHYRKAIPAMASR